MNISLFLRTHRVAFKCLAAALNAQGRDFPPGAFRTLATPERRGPVTAPYAGNCSAEWMSRPRLHDAVRHRRWSGGQADAGDGWAGRVTVAHTAGLERGATSTLVPE